jgi:hypothetical protein
MSQAGVPHSAPLLFGRDGELSRLRGLVNPLPSVPAVLVLLGEGLT